ncbi:hypothetical protein EMN47_13345 [Prolixibacteraceae bacterium JC049]|nr:hypothetical protein [Prolixibacteraceae bacterium JC049]
MITNNQLHRPFSNSARLAGWLLMIAGVISLLEGWGIVLILLGAFFALTRTGISIDWENRKVRSYSVLWGIRFGKWIDMKKYEVVRINGKTLNYSTMSWTNRQLNQTEEVFEIVLLERYRDKGLLIDVAVDLETARERATEYKKLLQN